jgi:hypothetical protein
MGWRSRQKYDTAVLSMIYLSGEGESGALNVKGNFHRAPHRGAGVMFVPSARSLPTRESPTGDVTLSRHRVSQRLYRSGSWQLSAV